MQPYSRPHNTNMAVEDFLKHALEMTGSTAKMRKVIAAIVEGELGVKYLSDEFQTLTRKEMRDGATRNEADRWKLREKIIEELFTLPQLENDDKIKLGLGGAMPRTSIKANQQAYILIGLPAAGKSGIAASIANKYGAAILDSDYAKRKLPEFNMYHYGASIVHEESAGLVFGFTDNPGKIDSLKTRCLDKKYNVIIPKIGNNPRSIYDMAKDLKEKRQYNVHLVLVALPKKEATVRAIKRYGQSKRYVPLGLIFDEYGNDPFTTYYYLRSKHAKLFASFCAVSTLEKPYFLTDKSHPKAVLEINLKNVILQLP